ncbi:MAG: T9SS type A sorting domain-containing protein [Bacteroidota bacterium]
MKKLISYFAAILVCATVQAQNLTPEVIASAGESFNNGSLSLEWTLGELATESLSNGGVIILTQGFHQPTDQVTSIEDPISQLDDVRVFPNPTSESLFVERTKMGNLDLVLWDMKGTVIMQTRMLTTSQSLDLSHLPSGVYVLRMSDEDQATRSVRIQKF